MTLQTSEEIALDCPYCRAEIYRPLAWFKQTYATCPKCHGGLAATQFETLIAELEQAFAAADDELVLGSRVCGCH